MARVGWHALYGANLLALELRRCGGNCLGGRGGAWEMAPPSRTKSTWLQGIKGGAWFLQPDGHVALSPLSDGCTAGKHVTQIPRVLPDPSIDLGRFGGIRSPLLPESRRVAPNRAWASSGSPWVYLDGWYWGDPWYPRTKVPRASHHPPSQVPSRTRPVGEGKLQARLSKLPFDNDRCQAPGPTVGRDPALCNTLP
eukprot:scaffold143_cov364-Pavlova_lutheri.AAC.6